MMGSCYFCGSAVGDDGLCFGCGEYICNDDDCNIGLMGSHAPEAHANCEEDKADDDMEW